MPELPTETSSPDRREAAAVDLPAAPDVLDVGAELAQRLHREAHVAGVGAVGDRALPGASAASISARWAWYLDGGIVISPSSGAWALATSRRTGGRITAPSHAEPAAGNRPTEWGVAAES